MDPARAETPRTRGNISHGNREIPRPAAARRETLAAARIVKPAIEQTTWLAVGTHRPASLAARTVARLVREILKSA